MFRILIGLVQPKLIADPRILGRTLVARVQIPILLQHSTVQLARIRQIARKLIGVQLPRLARPRLERGQLIDGRRIANPLNSLVVGDKVDVLHFAHVVHEPRERVHVLGLLEPRRMKVQSVRCPIGQIVSLEVGRQHAVHILAVQVWRTTIHHAATVLTGLQLVHDHFPDARVAARRTVLVVTGARVRHLVVERVRPQRRIDERRHHRRVVHETKLLHHQELTVPADAQKWHSHAAQVLHANVAEFVDDVRLADHLVEPVLDGGVARPPVLGTAVPGIE